MIVDVTGITLTPGEGGVDCLGNGTHIDKHGRPIECCCDECDYLLCCIAPDWKVRCIHCLEYHCPRHP